MRKTENDATAAPARKGDVLECGERANALVKGFLAGLMRQLRSVAAATDYVLALGPDCGRNAGSPRNERGMTGRPGGRPCCGVTPGHGDLPGECCPPSC